MPTARRSRMIAADPERVWELISDPHHMPRWWPGVKRMENVQDDRFTQVFLTKRGRHVRADFHLLDAEPPRRRVWEQETVGTPFERVLSESITEVLLEPDGGGTLVKIVQRQKLRGYQRTGGLLLRRASGKKLDEALDGLEQICA
ncbi:MAG: SRPBCC family protein [Solirubrobacterales bacterium]|nr:SRPBCC family protein [Solirubrobacterales bacterium]